MLSSSGRPTGEPSAANSIASGDLKLKLIWLTVFRVVATTLLMAAIALRYFSSTGAAELASEDSISFAVIAAVYLLSVVYGVVLRRGWVGPATAYVQVLGDVLLASALVYLTGGPESPFSFTYSLAVVAASILLYVRGALIAAAASSIAFAAMILLIDVGLLRTPVGGASLNTSRLVFVLTSNVLAQFLIAALASYLSRQLRLTGGRLSAREADLKKLASLHRQILTCMPSGLITCEADGQVSFINRVAASILGISSEWVKGLHVESLLPGVTHLDPEVRRNELTVETRAGPRILGLTVTALEGTEGALLIVFQDLTDLRRVENELKRADQLAAIGRLAAQLAHEIRNPLAAMRGSAQIIAGESPADTTSSRLSSILLRESDRLSVLVEDFLRFARPPPPVLQPTDLHRLLADTVEMLRADPLAAGVKIELELEAVTAAIDADQLRQVVINLLRNAFQAVKPGGGEVRVSVRRDRGAPQIRIWDSAGSISPHELGRIFEPFYTTRQGGTGLGLSSAHSIVRAHGGVLQVSSSKSEGTEFVIGLAKEGEVPLAGSGGR